MFTSNNYHIKICEIPKMHTLLHKLLTLSLSKLFQSTSYQGTYY